MLLIQGPATARDASVELQCRGSERLTCDVHIQFELESGAEGTRVVMTELLGGYYAHVQPVVYVSGQPELRIDGQLVTDVRLAPHRRVRFDLRYATLPAALNWDGPLSHIGYHPPLPIDARHPVLGESWRFYSGRLQVEILEIHADIRAEGPVRLEVSMPAGAELIVGQERVTPGVHQLAWLPGRAICRGLRQPPPLVHGGPVVTLGGLIRTDNAPTRFILGVGYELSFADYFILSAWVETDFESIQEAVLVELASPAYYIVPSVAAGVGVVSTQLGDRDVDVGLRMRATIDFYVAGFIADFDYFFLSGGWNIALAARLSL